MVLPEAMRLSYLSLLGIEQWVPRASAMEVSAVVAEAPMTAAPFIATAQPVASASDAPAQPASPAKVPAAKGASLPSGETAARLNELLASASSKAGSAANGKRSAVGVAENAAESSASLARLTPANNPPEPTAEIPRSTGTAAEASEHIGCAMLLLPSGVLLVADYSRPDAPGLASAESTMFMRIAAALAPHQTLPMPTEFSWPPSGMRLPGMDEPGAAARALGEILAQLRKRGLRIIAILGDAKVSSTGVARVLVPLTERMGLTAPVVTHSLAAMLLEPDLKHECWARLQPLKTDLPP